MLIEAYAPAPPPAHHPVSAKALAMELAPEAWQQIEWRQGTAEPDHYWLATLPADISFERMVDLTKLRWRIERDDLELKQELGLGHDEGRGWRGFHHHASLCIAAYGFLISEKDTFPPSGPTRARPGPRSRLPAGYRPRGSATALTTPHAKFNYHPAHPPRTNLDAYAAPMPMLRTNPSERRATNQMTQ